jgi:hypothetical protein
LSWCNIEILAKIFLQELASFVEQFQQSYSGLMQCTEINSSNESLVLNIPTTFVCIKERGLLPVNCNNLTLKKNKTLGFFHTFLLFVASFNHLTY